MSWHSVLSAWRRNLLGKEDIERELDDELSAYVQLLTEEKERSGALPAEARRAALLEAGGVEQLKESCRDARRLHWLDVLVQDLRYGARQVQRNRGFSATVIVTLGLAIGATTAIFSVVNAALLRPLPYPQPERLVYISEENQSFGVNPFSRAKEFLAWQRQSRTLSPIAAYNASSANLTGNGESERVVFNQATATLFPLLGVRPLLGRLFAPEDDKPGAAPVAVLTHATWQRRYHADPSVLGRSLVLDGKSHSIIGVLPADFAMPDRWEIPIDLWVPFALDSNTPAVTRAVGRLRDGVSLKSAQAELDAILQPTLRPGRQRQVSLSVWQSQITETVRPSLLVFLAAVFFVLLIACANIANLMLARASARLKEMAVRLALGAGKARIVRQLLTESAILALAGGVAGIAVAYWANGLLVAFVAQRMPSLAPATIDFRVLLFALVLALLTGFGFGLAPALISARGTAAPALREAGRSDAGGVGRHRLRNGLVIVEVALALMLSVGGGLLMQSFLRLRSLDQGYRTSQSLVFSVNLTPTRYPSPQEQLRFFQRVFEWLQILPGVLSTGANTAMPMGMYTESVSEVEMAGRPQPTGQLLLDRVSRGYFQAMGIPLRQGRLFTEADGPRAPMVAVVNESFARKYCPAGVCPGERMRYWREPAEWMTIVGVVGDIRRDLETDPEPQVYGFYEQSPSPFMTFVVTTAGGSSGMAQAIRGEIAAIDKDEPPHRMKTLDELKETELQPHRVNLLLLGSFALLALTLGVIGIYGVVSYSVGRRTGEIGIRMALGAGRGRVVALIARQGLLLVAWGVALGLAGALALNRTISSMVFGISTTHPATYAAIAGLWVAIALLACLIPAHRASRIDPMSALRCE